MNLISVNPDTDCEALYKLLSERPKEANISHKEMPKWTDHVAFVYSKPYKAWYLIEDAGLIRGAVYLTDANEIGIGILSEHRGKGYGPKAVEAVMEAHGPGRYLANIAPGNEVSIGMFEKLSFQHIQNTYERVT